MRPRSNRIWFPVGRLGAFFVAVVVFGTLLLDTLRLPVDRRKAGLNPDFVTRQKKRLRARWRIFKRYFQRSFGLSLPDARIESEPARFLASFGPEPSLFDPPAGEWIEPVRWVHPLPPPPPREIDLNLELNGLSEPIMNAELHAEWARKMKFNFGLDVGDALVSGPEALVDSVVRTALKILPQRGRVRLDPDGGEQILDRILDIRMNQRRGSFTREFMDRMVEEEQDYFASFQESGLDSFAFRDGRSDIDTDRLLRDQGKIAWDALRKTYGSKFDYTGEKAIRDDAFHFAQWRGLDFIAMPPLMAGYFYYRGMDKTFSMAGTELSVGLEPIRLWTRGNGDLTAGLTLEWRIRDWPVAVIATAGRHDGAFEVEFVGIGTSAGMAVQALGFDD